ncbi:similar to Saccharomyces cerevisiae YLR390W-A CCW14 Covalently linked cell wall glycoprotein, present in the inner layer of the cell wall [Maudiozyma barnettii]|uniref:Similar to Saccharomyces cerevisiae YLR390W-A CCW14 Covalently linked cell wall glycoprotein, present in the inner layer of the cell wall n=1 Tax=Maudiozyma barnettii TaxID=61262 RepID=A0A8H2ZIR1_9SACH|nr:Ccw14p [Kazachstania barnettii]CAB4256163.1 similar to Saccharomyces cerevisiae YLR390W-A CCW14 Covalently linked cell wall glycoprotein, present in the inner layer of the cell wall [Kazachstania barnettii]CAD1784771.1 similar to Saccharomyces cerevisiae YLR390W-A CCW14 Covalently linked cell wall glycoprotein, present in the inner layer of the cell wall [Kazachstania barnettii]
MRTSAVLTSVLSLALLSKEVLATPPACLLACVAQVTSGSSQCKTLSNLDCVCSSESSAVKSCLDSICPNGNADAAYSAFKSSCSDQNISLGDSSSSSSAASSSSSSTSASSSSEKASSSSAIVSSSSSSEAAASTSTEASVEASVEVTTTSSSTEAPTTTSTITSVSEEPTTSSESTTSSTSSTKSIVSVSQGGANLLQLGGSLAVVAAAALLI